MWNKELKFQMRFEFFTILAEYFAARVIFTIKRNLHFFWCDPIGEFYVHISEAMEFRKKLLNDFAQNTIQNSTELFIWILN